MSLCSYVLLTFSRYAHSINYTYDKKEFIVSIISVCNMKGGVGKTMLSLILTTYFASKGRTLAIDLDPQGNMSSFFTKLVPEEHKTMRIFDAKEADPDPQPLEITKNLFLFGADLKLSAIEPHATFNDYLVVQEWVRKHGKEYDSLIIDSPPNLGLFSSSTLLATEYVIVPVDVGESAIEGLRSLLASMRTTAKRGNSEIKVLGIVMTRRRQTSYAEEFERELRAEFKANVFQTVIPETAAYKEYMFRHRQIPTDSRTYKSVQAFTQEVSARIKENS